MKKIDNFENITEAGEFKPLPKGIYPIKITDVVDYPDNEYLEVSWDIVKGEFKGFISLLSKDTYKFKRSYKTKALPFFKGFITAIEKSNANYHWNWDEKTLIGKYAVGIVGEEEYIDKDGNVRITTRLVEIRSVEKFNDGTLKVPELKKVTEDDWKVWREKNGKPANESIENVEIADDDLPF